MRCSELSPWSSGVGPWAEDSDTHCSRWVLLQWDEHLSMMHIHVFAAYFGLAVAWCLSRPLPKEVEEKDQSTISPSLFAMLGKDKVVGGFTPGVSRRLQNALQETSLGHQLALGV